MLCIKKLIHTHAHTQFYFQCLCRGHWPMDKVHPVTAVRPPTPLHTRTYTHTTPSHTWLIQIDCSSMVLSLEPNRVTAGLCWWCLLRLTPWQSHCLIHTSPVSYFFLCHPLPLSSSLIVLPPLASLSAATAFSALLQLFLAGSCVHSLFLPQKQKTLGEEWLEYRFVPQSIDFFSFSSRLEEVHPECACAPGPWTLFKV